MPSPTCTRGSRRGHSRSGSQAVGPIAGITRPVTPAAHARASTPSRSASKRGTSRWQWVSITARKNSEVRLHAVAFGELEQALVLRAVGGLRFFDEHLGDVVLDAILPLQARVVEHLFVREEQQRA